MGGEKRNGLLCCACALNRLLNLGDLVARTNDGVSSIILGPLGVFVFPLRPLPDFDLATATNDTNSHSREQVVCCIRVKVDAAVEHGGSIFAESALDERFASRMLVDEVGDIVDDTGDSDKTAAVLNLLNVIVPLDDGELIEGSTPVKLRALLVKFLLELLHTTLLDLVGAELLEVIGEAELAPDPDAPLGGVVLVPLDSITVVGRELVVEVVVTLAEGDESSDDVIPGAVAVVEGLVSEPVGKRVDAEGSLLDEEDAENAGVDVSAPPVSPSKTSDQSGEDQAHEENNFEVVLVLPDDDRVLVQIRDVGAANTLGVLLHDHPANVAVHQALAHAVGILVGVGVAVVSAVVTAPPTDGALDGTASYSGEEDAQWEPCGVRLVSPETMVAGSDTETGPEVVDYSPDGGLPPQRRPEGGNAAHHWDPDDEEDLKSHQQRLLEAGGRRSLH